MRLSSIHVSIMKIASWLRANKKRVENLQPHSQQLIYSIASQWHARDKLFLIKFCVLFCVECKEIV